MKSQLENLVHMANQIASNNATWGTPDDVTLRVGTHLKKFWAPSMLTMLAAYAGDDLNPIARDALKTISNA
ncbi:formate dehydrogenase [Litorivicinus lipolyticus]|uniref:Formate dehydrogenase n=1 Tax=Litorivicinus lipolyticus TaxID=418701 RepID=A0A5Q2QDN6_9GAMM|nr:formate dehydrogenase subunit delta [Litorivicinus lipolyticus]QGG80452.1 formate dehydrogenase [Litorivicinus lipolyticus]